MWPGQQPPGGEQNPQDQNPYQQPGYQQPNPYQQPGYQETGYPQPNPYGQQPGQPQWGFHRSLPGRRKRPAVRVPGAVEGTRPRSRRSSRRPLS